MKSYLGGPGDVGEDSQGGGGRAPTGILRRGTAIGYVRIIHLPARPQDQLEIARSIPRPWGSKETSSPAPSPERSRNGRAHLGRLQIPKARAFAKQIPKREATHHTPNPEYPSTHSRQGYPRHYQR